MICVSTQRVEIVKQKKAPPDVRCSRSLVLVEGVECRTEVVAQVDTVVCVELEQPRASAMQASKLHRCHCCCVLVLESNQDGNSGRDSPCPL